MTEYKSYWYVCTSCDASIEVVSKGIHMQDPTCNCNQSNVVWCQTSVVESDPKLAKEEQMETTEPTLAERYDNSAKIIVKNTNTGELVYDELSPYDINCLLVDTHYQKQLLAKSNSAVDSVRDIILEAYADSEDQETLRAIAEALDIQLTKTIEWSATMYVSGSMDVDLFEDFDLESELSDNLQVSAWNGDIEVEEYHVEDAREC